MNRRPLHETLKPGQEIRAPDIDRGVCYLCRQDGIGETTLHGDLLCAGCRAKHAEAIEAGRRER